MSCRTAALSSLQHWFSCSLEPPFVFVPKSELNILYLALVIYSEFSPLSSKCCFSGYAHSFCTSCWLFWLWGHFSQREGSGCSAPAIRPLPLHLLKLFSSAVLAVNTATGLSLSLPVLSSHRQSPTKYTHQAAQDRELWEPEIYVCQM